MIILDRETDSITPMLTQMTYSGLLDEMFGNQFGYHTFDLYLIDEKAAQEEDARGGGKKTIDMKFDDEVWDQVKDCNIKYIGAKLMKMMMEARDNLKDIKNNSHIDDLDKITKMKEVSKKLKMMEAHLNISHKILTDLKEPKARERLLLEQNILEDESEKVIMKEIEDWVLDRKKLPDIYTISALQSLIQNGISDKLYDFVRKEVLETYSFTQLTVFNHLEKTNLLTKKSRLPKKEKSIFQKLKSNFKLMQDLPENAPASIGNQPYDAYVPMCARLLMLAVFDGWKNSHIRNTLPGEVEIHGDPSAIINSRKPPNGPPSQKFILVYMIGGMTLGEAASLRAIAKLAKVELMMATTDIINRKDMIGAFMGGDK